MPKKFRLDNVHEIDGYIIHIIPVDNPSKDFYIRVIILEVMTGRYEQEVPISFINERMNVSDGFAVGEHVHVTFQIRGKSHISKGKKKWYANIDGLNMSKL